LVNYVNFGALMLKVSTKSTYALRALMDMAHHSDGQPVRLPDVAKRQNIPLPFLEQIFSKLKKGGLVQAVRGPLGGYLLTRPPEEISLSQIVTILEGPIEPVLCSQPQNKSEKCHEVEGCLSRLVCSELDGELFRVLSRYNLASLRSEANRLLESHA
jgi:Rrf2 family protein